MTAEQQASPVRTVADGTGRTWHAYVVVARLKFERESGKRRRNWLSFESSDERRYITPVPDGWDHWSDDQLRAEISAAKQDLRT
jgi:hypothetical protein